MYNNAGGQQSPSGGIRFTFLTPSDQSKFEQLFIQSAGAFGGNKIGAQAVGELLKRSNLDNESLARIWDLSSISNAAYMTFPEFAIAMYLTSRKLIGQEVPRSLPSGIREEVEVAIATIASTETASSQQQQRQHQQQLIDTTISQPSMVNPQISMMTGTPNQIALRTGVQNMQSMRSIAPQMPMQTGYMNQSMTNFQSPMQTGFHPTPPPAAPKPRLQNLDFAKKMMPNQNGVTNLLNPSLGTSEADKLSWKISPQDKQRYRDIFNAWEGSGSGFMSGDTAKDVFTQSQLPPDSLMKIWNLADSENRGSLDVDEFCIAMHLIYRKANGFEIPSVLPPELAPPSSVLKKFVLGRRPPPSVPSFSPQPKHHSTTESQGFDDSDDYVSSSRRKGQPNRSYAKYNAYPEDEVDAAVLEDLRRQIYEEKRALDRIDIPRNTKHSSSKYGIDELKENIRKSHVELARAIQSNPTASKYAEQSEALVKLMETQKSLQDEIQYLCNRDIPVLARQLRGAAAELRDAKIRHGKKSDGAQDFMAYIQPTGPGGSITESDRVRAKAKAMMAARKVGGSATSSDSGFVLRRAEEEKEEADRLADSVERDMERSRTGLLDMRGDLRYLEETTAHLEDKKRFEINQQDLSYELRRFIEELDARPVSQPSYSTNSFNSSFSSLSISNQSSKVSSPAMPSAVSSPASKPAPPRPRTAEEIKKEAERRVQERLAAIQVKRTPTQSPKPVNTPRSMSFTPSISKPDDAEIVTEERELLGNTKLPINQRETVDRYKNSNNLEQERVIQQRLEEQRREEERVRNQREEEKRREEEKDLEDRRRRVLEKEEADRKARYEAIKREEEEEEERKRAQQKQIAQEPQLGHKPEEIVNVSEITTDFGSIEAQSTVDPLPKDFAAESSSVAAPPPTAVAQETDTVTNTNNPFAKFQVPAPEEPSQVDKPNETTNKRTSYNPFASFSAFSATKAGSKDSDSDNDSWGPDDHSESEDEDEFPAAGSAKNLAGKLFSVLSQRTGGGSPISSPKPETPSIYNSATASPASASSSITASANIPPPPPPPQQPIFSDAFSTPPPPPPPPSTTFGISDAPPPPAAPPAPQPPSTTTQSEIAPPNDMRNALLGQIQQGKSLKKTKTNDRSVSSKGRVLG
ncbi:hypothetical protein BY458DRAFT_498805 [Sporodiniella umbellata]|nr:hypothetical protein BY458DRAFT_498805 [Sporodiniella umbellata]